MTLYMVFAGLGILTYAGVALAEMTIAGFSGAHVAVGIQPAFEALLSVFLRQPSSSTRIASCGSTRRALAEPLHGDGASSSPL